MNIDKDNRDVADLPLLASLSDSSSNPSTDPSISLVNSVPMTNGLLLLNPIPDTNTSESNKNRSLMHPPGDTCHFQISNTKPQSDSAGNELSESNCCQFTAEMDTS
ncbi:unnamed protein product [Protopolystoma xenopodis]|uniref:Uncharacterized protein n=1 Tax=Protopolystoma xenopodis TaxID=117903 RepID=A0A448WHH0_9PLAT|nr:unnamed protein product [Protopolystoma xenopodis]